MFAITFVCASPVLIAGIDLTKVTFASDIPIAVGIGILLTGYAPTLAALIVARLFSREGGVGALMRPVLRWRVSPAWYVAVFAAPILLFLAAVGLHVAGGGVPPPTWLSIPSGADLSFLVGALVAGAFGEEVGWRGLAQPRLQQRYTPLVASVIVGGVWATWHIWPIITPGGGGITWLIALETYARLIATSVIYAWIFNATGGSLLLVMLAHAGHNIAVRVVAPPPGSDTDLPLLVAALYVVVAILVVAFSAAAHARRVHGDVLAT